jgi:hypothetical protein
MRRSALGVLARRPRLLVVGGLVLLQWIAVAVYAVTTTHNGWLFYQGGDQTWYWSTTWLLSEGTLPLSYVGYGWSYLLSPVALVAGPSFLDGLPVVLLVQVLVLLPLALVCVYALAARLAGRHVAAAAGLLWIAIPFLLSPFFVERYREKWVDLFLPQAFGLTGLTDFVSLVAVAVAAVFVFRTLDGGGDKQALLAGLAAGFAVGVKPANALFLIAVALALAVARRWREAVVLALALAPALVALAVWKYRGLGNLPVLALDGSRVAAGEGYQPPIGLSLGRYIDLDWGRLDANFVALQEVTWSVRIIEFLPLAGAIAVARRSLPKAVFLLAWVASFVVVKGTAEAATVDSGSFFRLLMPAWPAYFLLAVSLPLLVPRVGGILAAAPARPPAPPSRRVLAAAGLLLGLVPVVLFAALPATKGQRAVREPGSGVYVPVVDELRPTVERRGGAQRLAWRKVGPGPGTHAFYRVYRIAGSDGVTCVAKGADECTFEGATTVATTRETAYTDRPPRGDWFYRVGVVANWRDDPTLGDLLLLGTAARAAT